MQMAGQKVELTEQELDDKIKAATEVLARKNSELLAELKEARKGKQYNADDVAKLEETIEALQSDLSKSAKELKSAQKLAEAASKSLESEQAAVRNLLVDNGLTDALTKVGVTNPYRQKAAKALLERQVKLDQDGDTRIAKMGDKLLMDAINEWASSEEGKHFVEAQANSGGGAAGGGRGNGGAGAVKGKIDGTSKERTDYFASKYDFSAT
jgi:type I restriction-modification system DNA methylase subunit